MQLNKAKITLKILDGKIGFTMPFLSTCFGKQTHNTVFVSKIKKNIFISPISEDYRSVADYCAQFDGLFSWWSTALRAHFPPENVAYKLAFTFRSKAKTVTEIFSPVPKQKDLLIFINLVNWLAILFITALF